MHLPHVHPGQWPQTIGQNRFASRLCEGEPQDCSIALIGLPDDLGVRMNNGRPGAAAGPDAFRAALARYGAANPLSFTWPGVFDAGDVMPVADDLHATHQRVTETVRTVVDAGFLPVGIGGGHDLTFPFVRAVAEAMRDSDGGDAASLVGVYFDAHLDVREEDGSGMPFRRLIEGGYCRSLHVHGLDDFAVSREHLAWFQSHGGRIDPFGPADEWPDGELFVSFDLDVLDQSCAPGVSAMNPCGWSTELGCRWARAAGRCQRVRCFDIMELSPAHDPDGRTARLAARLFYEFIRGYSERSRG
jgi:formiminoglutamase